MPYPLAVNDVVGVLAVAVNNEQAALNMIHGLVSAVGVSPATDADVSSTMDALNGPFYKLILSTNSSYHGTGVRIISRVPTVPMAVDTGSAGPGTVAPPDQSRQTCGIISWTTQLAGRAYRGRTYIPFPAIAADVGDGTPTAAYRTLLTTYANNFLGPTNIVVGGRTAVILWGVYGRALPARTGKHGPLPARPAQFTAFEGFSTPVKWATQRRRGSYGRGNAPPF